MPKPEVKAANRLLLYAMLLAASYTVMRSVGDSLFLSRVGSDSLAVVFFASGLTTALLASIWFALTRRLSITRSLKISGYASAALTLAAWAALPWLHHSWWLLAAIYLLTELKGCVNTINVVTATNEILGGHSSGHAWARIGLGAPFAGVVIGVMIGIEASLFDLRTWLLLSVVLDLLAVLPLANASRLVVPGTNAAAGSTLKSALVTTNKLKEYACSRQFRYWIGVLIAAKVVVLTLITFFWKVSVTEYFVGNEQSLARYFGIFYAATGLLTLLLQGFVTGRLLSRRSLHFPIMLMPVALSILSTAIVFGAGALFLVVVVTLAKSVEVWRRSVHDTTLSMLYTKIERRQRRAAISFNTAVIKPLAEVGASLVLLLGSVAWHKSTLLLAVGIWIIATLALLRLTAQITKKRALPRTSSSAMIQNQTTCSELA